MSSLLKQNFEKFCNDYKFALEEEMGKGDDDPVQEKAIDKKPDYETSQKLLRENGRKGEEIVASLLSKVFDDDTRMIEQHLSRYFEFLTKDGVLKGKDIN